MDIQEIRNTISQLESGETTFDACIKLASLYTVINHINVDDVQNELDDILPAYKTFVEVKRKYQLGEVTQDKVLIQFKTVFMEITELIDTMYSSTDSPEERYIIVRTLTNLYEKYVRNP